MLYNLKYNFNLNSNKIKLIASLTITSILSLLLILWLVDYSSYGLPAIIPMLNIKTYATFIVASYMIIFIYLHKQLLYYNSDASLFELITCSIFISFFSIFIYEIIKQCIILKEAFLVKLFSITIASTAITIMLSLIATDLAFKKKKINGIKKFIPYTILIIFYLLAKPYLTLIDW